MSTSVEDRAQIRHPGGLRPPPLAQLGKPGEPHAFSLDATDYDTADLRLIRSRLTCAGAWAATTPAGTSSARPAASARRCNCRMPMIFPRS